MTLPIHDLISPDYARKFPESYRELLLETCQEFDRACTRDIVRLYSENTPEISIGAHIDRMLALESALEMEEETAKDRELVASIYVSNALDKVRDNLHELAGIVTTYSHVLVKDGAV